MTDHVLLHLADEKETNGAHNFFTNPYLPFPSFHLT